LIGGRYKTPPGETILRGRFAWREQRADATPEGADLIPGVEKAMHP
jgi:hypothetical protein